MSYLMASRSAIPSDSIVSLLDKLGLERGISISWSCNRNIAHRCLYRLLHLAVTAVTRLARLLSEVGIHFSFQGGFDDVLNHRSEGSVFAEQRLARFDVLKDLGLEDVEIYFFFHCYCESQK